MVGKSTAELTAIHELTNSRGSALNKIIKFTFSSCPQTESKVQKLVGWSGKAQRDAGQLSGVLQLTAHETALLQAEGVAQVS
jgi:hypothetical protein